MQSIRWLTLTLMGSACGVQPLAKPDPVPEQQTDMYLDINPNRKLDLLVMVDNSASMEMKQTNLANHFNQLIGQLRKIPGGMPDLHLAVISSDSGAGNWDQKAQGTGPCHPGGDRGEI